MKKIIVLLLLAVLAFAGVQCGGDDNPAAPTVTYNLRDTGPAGGIIFYINPNASTDGWTYLEAWTADEGTYIWKTSYTSTTGTSTAIGTGYANTYTYMTGTEHPAAEVVRNATHGGKNDWFLPSKDELNKMYINLKSGTDENGVSYTAVGGFAADYYWSSSEYSSSDGWYQYFYFGTQYGVSKNYLNLVRCVRAF